MDKKRKRELIGAFVAVLLIGYLLTQIEFGQLLSTLGSIHPVYILLCFGIYFSSYFLRALRFKVILGDEAKYLDLLKVLFIHNMVNQVLPARTGEISYVYLMEKRGLSINKGISSLALARVFDLIGIAILFLVALLVLKEMNTAFLNLMYVMSVVVGMALFSLFCLFIYKKKFIDKVQGLTEVLKVNKYDITQRALEKGEEAIEDMQVIRSRKVFLYSTLISIAIWFTSTLMVYTLLAQMDIMLSIWEVCLGSMVLVITSILPIHSVGGFGTTESVWASIYISLGVSKEMAITSGIGVHLIIFSYLVIIGIAGLVLMRMESSAVSGGEAEGGAV